MLSTRDSYICYLWMQVSKCFCILDQLPKQTGQLARKFDSVAAYMQLFGLTGSRQCSVVPVARASACIPCTTQVMMTIYMDSQVDSFRSHYRREILLGCM